MKKFIKLFLCSLLMFFWGTLAAQNVTVQGTVTDATGETIVGANVVEKGTRNSTVTDVNGNFSLTVADNAVLKVSFLGYVTQEVPATPNMTVTLTEEAKVLDEMVVTGYGSQKRASIVGAITTIEPQKLRVGTTKSVGNNLAGQMAGIIAVRRTGEPGFDNSDIWIRGLSTWTGSTTPLVLVDGIERDLHDYDVTEIESFSILKDASASAMYGVRGANGVVLITTKRGSVAPPSIEFNVEQSIQTPTKLPEFIGAIDYMNLLNRLADDASYPRPFSEEAITRTATGYDRDLYPDVNWLDAITKDFAYSTRANMTVSGGTPMLRYAMVASYFNEEGIMATDESLPYNTGTNLQRYNLRANVDLNVTPTTLFRFNIGGYLQHFRKQLASTADAFSHAFANPPFVFPTMYSDGVIPKRPGGANAWAEVTQTGYKKDVSNKLESLFSVEQDLRMILPGLKAKIVFSYDTWNSSTVEREQKPTYYAPSSGRDFYGNLIHGEPLNNDGTEFLGHKKTGEYGNNGIYFEPSLTYNHTFADTHEVDVLFLYNQRSYDDGDIQPFRNQGIAGRLSYTFDRRYIAEVNFGYNGSENFAKGYRYGFFPSAAVGWFVSEEAFMAPVKNVLNKLKIRASIGQAGNADIGGRRFGYITTINMDNDHGYYWGLTGDYWRQGVREGTIGISNLTWETVTKTNIGLEIGLCNALDLQIDVFKERRTNILIERNTVPEWAGFLENPWANYGIVDNQGLDAQLVFSKQFGKDFFINLRGSFTYAKNEIVECDEPASRISTYRSYTGHPINTHRGYIAERLFTADDFDQWGNLNPGIPDQQLGSIVHPGDIKYVDRNNDGVINGLDEGIIGGTVDPKMVYGFGATMQWKNLDFGFFFQGTADAYQIMGGNSFFVPGSGGGVSGNVYSNYTDAWTEENPSQDAFWPRLSYATNPNNTVSSTWWKKDMSFLRLKTIELGYTLPEKWVKPMAGKRVRVYVSGNDLFYFSAFKLWDPELGSNDGLLYPAMRSILFGVRLNF
jgi:TonB-linked SusC/RagA family outer membrane protein